MSQSSLRKELKNIVNILPDLAEAKAIVNIFDNNIVSSDLRMTLLDYLKLYNLPSYKNDEVILTIGTFKAFDFDVVAQIYSSKNCPIDSSVNQYRGIIIFIHGYLDHFGMYSDFIKYYLAKHYIVIGLDLPGHGLSSGRIGDIVDFGQYAHCVEELFDIINKKYNSKLEYIIAGFSAGAAIITEFLLRNNNSKISGHRIINFKKNILIAPLLRVPFWHYTKIACYLTPFIKHVPRESTNISHNTKFVNFIKHNDPLQPRYVPTRWVRAMHHWAQRLPKYRPIFTKTLIIQGTADYTVDWKFSVPNYARIYKNHLVVYIPDGYHNLCNESEEYVSKVLDSISEFLEI